MSTYFVFFNGLIGLCILCAPGTDCIMFHRKIAGSQIYGHKELILLTFHGLNLAAIHEQGEWQHHL